MSSTDNDPTPDHDYGSCTEHVHDAPSTDLHWVWMAQARVAEPGARYAVIYECRCGCGETWQPENELPASYWDENP